jgi:hypothetical protein
MKMKIMTTNPIVAGALIDFVGFLTTKPNRPVLGGPVAPYAAQLLLTDWAKSRGLDLKGADVKGWMKPRPRREVTIIVFGGTSSRPVGPRPGSRAARK